MTDQEREEERWRGSVETTLSTIDKGQTALGVAMEKMDTRAEETTRDLYHNMARMTDGISNGQKAHAVLAETVDNHIESSDHRFGLLWKILLYGGGGATVLGAGAKVAGIIP